MPLKEGEGKLFAYVPLIIYLRRISSNLIMSHVRSSVDERIKVKRLLSGGNQLMNEQQDVLLPQSILDCAFFMPMLAISFEYVACVPLTLSEMLYYPRIIISKIFPLVCRKQRRHENFISNTCHVFIKSQVLTVIYVILHVLYKWNISQGKNIFHLFHFVEHTTLRKTIPKGLTGGKRNCFRRSSVEILLGKWKKNPFLMIKIDTFVHQETHFPKLNSHQRGFSQSSLSTTSFIIFADALQTQRERIIFSSLPDLHTNICWYLHTSLACQMKYFGNHHKTAEERQERRLRQTEKENRIGLNKLCIHAV